MAESMALLVDEVLPEQPIRQWMLSFPLQLLHLFATHLIKKAGLAHQTAEIGAVTLLPRLGNALNLNVHFHMLFLDGVYLDRSDGTRFRWVKALTNQELTQPPTNVQQRAQGFWQQLHDGDV